MLLLTNQAHEFVGPGGFCCQWLGLEGGGRGNGVFGGDSDSAPRFWLWPQPSSHGCSGETGCVQSPPPPASETPVRTGRGRTGQGH